MRAAPAVRVRPAFGDEHPPLAQSQIGEPQPEHLAAPEAAEHHGLGHGPVPLGAQRAHERLDLVGVEDPGQPAARHARAADRVQSVIGSGGWRCPRDRVGADVDVVAGDEIAIEGRHRGQPSLDRRRREPKRPSAMRTTFSAPGLGRRWAVTKAMTSLGLTWVGSSSPPRRRHSGRAHRPARCSGEPADHELQEFVHQWVADSVFVLTVGTDVALE